jgi:hypothetical protein
VIASNGLAQQIAETRFIEEEEAGGSTTDQCRQRDWLGVSNVKFSTNLREWSPPLTPRTARFRQE